MTAPEFAQVVIDGLMLAAIYILVASGLTLVFSIMHIINFAHGEFYMLGAFVIYLFFKLWGAPYLLALVAAILLVGLLGRLVERFFLRPFHGQLLPGLVVSLGISLFLSTGALLAFGEDDKSIPSAVSGVIRILGTFLTYERMMVIVVSFALIGALAFFIRWVKAGQAMMACSQDSEVAALMGIDIRRTSALAMTLGTGLAAAAGALMGPIFFINPYIGLMPLFKGLIIVIVGGLGSVPGVVLAGLILGFVESFGLTYIGYYSNLLGFGLILLILLARPRGLMGHE